MEKNGWKTLAIVFMVLFFTFVAFGVYAIIDENNKYDKMNTCYYEICGEYPEAGYENNVCSCYDYDVLGYLQVVEIKYMG